MSGCSSTESIYVTNDFTKSNVKLTDNLEKKTLRERSKRALKKIKHFFRSTTVEPCLFIYMLCTALSSMAVQNMHLEKSCRVNLKFDEEICDRIRDRNTTGIEQQLIEVQSLVAKVVAWKFPLQTAIPAVMVLFIGAWSDKTKKRKICMLFPFVGEITTNIGLLFATYYFYDLSLISTALIEALPPAFTGSYIIIFMGMYSYIADITTIESRTFRMGIVSVCVSLGTPTGTALSGLLLRAVGYYGVFSVLLVLHISALTYGLLRIEDTKPSLENKSSTSFTKSKFIKQVREIVWLVVNTILVALRPRPYAGRIQIWTVILLYLIMVGPLYGDSQVGYLYAIRKFNLNEVEYSLYGTINVILGLVGTTFCITILNKRFGVEDSIIGAIAGVSRIAACFFFAFAPNRSWYYAAPVVNMMSHSSLATIRSISSKTVPIEEVAKLNALLGVTETLAPTIYMPTSSFIYVSTIETFPGAFYMFDAALTVVALLLFWFIYKLVKRRNKAVTTNSKESNEVSRF